MLIEKVSVLHRPLLNKFMRLMTFLGDHGKIWFAVLITICLVRRSVYIGVSILFSVLFAFISSEVIIKRMVCRVRPCHKIDEEDLILKKIPKYYSFPSSHSATSFAMVTLTMLHCSVWTVLIVLVLAILISFSRFYLQAHYATDVLCGILIGIITSYLMYRVIYLIFMAIDPSLIQ